MATEPLLRTGSAYVPVDEQEAILRSDSSVIRLVFADESVSLTYACRAAGERVTDLHVHRHTEAFYVLEGELTFQVGAERELITLGAGGFVAVPPGVAHSFRAAGDHPARWLIIHAPDRGFADFMRSLRDGAQLDWDMSSVPGDGGLSVEHAVVRRPPHSS